jgi:hypothetical protein
VILMDGERIAMMGQLDSGQDRFCRVKVGEVVFKPDKYALADR